MENEVGLDASNLDLTRANSARMYDYDLGGSANFAVDREAAEQRRQAMPDTPWVLQLNRAFLWRTVRYLVRDCGIDQFLDLGSGIPTVGNVHEIAHRHNPHARIAYVDWEAVAVSHTRRLLGEEEHRVSMTQADIRDPACVLAAPGVVGLLDFTRPIGLLAIGILLYLPDDEQTQHMMSVYREALAPGSYCAVAHLSPMHATRAEMDCAHQIMAHTDSPSTDRSPQQIRALLAGYDLVDPGLVPLPSWRPDEEPTRDEIDRSNCYAAVGLLRAAR